MRTASRLRRGFHAATVVFGVVAAAALLWRPAPPSGEIAPAGPAALEPPHPAAGGADGAVIIIDANIFSRERVAPAVRYDPLATGPEDEFSMVDPLPPEPDTAVAETTPRLYGTVLGPAGRVALMRLDPSLPSAQVYREGDRAAGYHVLRIDEQSVVLGTPQGRIVLRLTRSEGAMP
jgi:hypothetical protein